MTLQYEETLILLLAEEGTEVAQAATKMLRFGTESLNPYNGLTNYEALVKELGDVMAVAEILGIPQASIDEAKNAKITKLQQRIMSGEPI